jgi:hypothetical protein
VLPRYADPLRWDVFVDAPGALHVGTLGVTAALDPPPGRLRAVATNLDIPAAAAVLSGCAGAVLRAFFRFPVATLLENEIVVRDLRFDASAPGEFAVVRLRLGSDGTPSLGLGECP